MNTTAAPPAHPQPGTASDPVVVASGLTVSFPVPGGEPVRVLHGIDLEVADGEFVAIMGPSGSGKSTLLYALSGLTPHACGRVRLAGEDVASLSPAALERLRLHRLGFVFQQPHLLPGLTLAENVELPAHWGARADKAAVRARVRALLARMGVGEIADNDANAASGGQRQRVGIARALINDPRVVFADEPTGALDSAATEAVLDLLLQVNADGVTLVVVTHDPRVAARARRLVLLTDGRVCADLTLGPFSADALDERTALVTRALDQHR